jgi:hypothetical protein
VFAAELFEASRMRERGSVREVRRDMVREVGAQMWYVRLKAKATGK